ncbi:MAG: GTP 3',8-cyclase MoaA [Desulfomonilia bacterium]
MDHLYDMHSRRIRYVRISVTDRCNFRCQYCMPPEGVNWLPHEMIMRYEEYIRIMKILVSHGVDKVRITGGEPLLRRGLTGFIQRLSAIEGIRDLSLTTNGMLMSTMAKELRDAGLNRVNISLDTLDRTKFAQITRVDAYDMVRAGIERALECGLSPVKINVVAIRGFNDDEIPDFARMTLSDPVEIRFIELMPMGCIARHGNQELISSSEVQEIIENIHGPLEPLEYSLGPARVFKIPGARGKIGLIGAMSEHTFCHRCNRIRITSSGGLRPCLFSEETVDLLSPMRRGITDGELDSLIISGVKMKPLNHGLCRGKEFLCGRESYTLMNSIGG